MKQYKYHYFYRIENLINGNYYYGIHSTNNLEDKYMGSGSRLREAINMFGKENFTKEILKYFNTREKASEYEAMVVTEELVHDKKCYNIKCGGDYGVTSGTILVKDKDNKWQRVSIDDERYKNGELVNFMTDCVSVFDKNEEKYKIISKDEFLTNRTRYVTYSEGKVSVKDANGNHMVVSIDDERYKNGELVPIWNGRHHSAKTKKKMSETHKKNHHQQGEKNSQYGTCWITKGIENKKVKKTDLSKYLYDGWKIGRYIDNSKIVLKLDSVGNEKILELYSERKNWTKVARILGVNRSVLLNYRKKRMR